MNTDFKIEAISKQEKQDIEADIKIGIIDRWFESGYPGVIAGFILSTAFFVLYYNSANIFLLSLWLGGYYFFLFLVFSLIFYYKKFKLKLEVQKWNLAVCVIVPIFAVFWGITIFFNPHDEIQSFILVTILVMIAACFSMFSVGMILECFLCVSLILSPVSVWLFLQSGFYYKVGAIFIIVPMIFFIQMNRLSSKWFLSSLKLSRMLASSTHLAHYELLTDLPNQRLLTKYIEESISTAKLSGENFALVSFGINRLEIFNNSLGYHVGDLIMNSLAKRLATLLSKLNEADGKVRLLTRPRQDILLILVAPITLENINEEVKQLFLTLDDPFHLEDREARLSASVGVTIFPQDSEDPAKLLSNAYAAMFEAKLKGGNQILFYKSVTTNRAPQLIALESDLPEALQKNELEVYYQPLVDLQEGLICGMEALIRWNHPTRGMVSPLDFIPLAEETGLIIPIGEWVLEQAARQTVIWHKKGFENLGISVNLSPKQLREGNLIETIDTVLKKTGLSPQKLELELTEVAVLNESLSPLINEISKRGISLAIDDFGTGYSGLSYLKYFHIDKIKIDKSFIQDVVNNNDSAAIVTATLAMARELHIKTIAEGVETKEQLTFLKDRGCQYIQGFYFSKPVNAAEFEKLLEQGIFAKLI